jgi:cyclopropane-fatty-acyl-phospholipid synthase
MHVAQRAREFPPFVLPTVEVVTLFARPLLDAIMGRLLQYGGLTLIYPDGSASRFGKARQAGIDASPHVTVVLRRWSTVRGLVTNPALVFGEAFVDGDLAPVDCEIQEVLDLVYANIHAGGRHPGQQVRRFIGRSLRRISQFNPIPRARRNAAHHYDLNGRLYALFLDEDRQYSCAYFARGDETLEAAQEAKKHHIATKLLLDRPDLEVLDIGCGWGGMALTLARDYGARVTGITLSQEQLAYARQRAAKAGLSHRIRFELLDYRTVAGPFDRIVSVGMFEHVGVTHYAAFFRRLRRLLTEDGIALIHAIGRSDGPNVTNPWLARHIFPGGYSPALSEVFRAVERERLVATDCEILRLHYARTIAHWRARFTANRHVVAALYDERFCRMFDLYLAGSELTFRHLGHMVWQLQLARRQEAVPLTRDYLRGADGQRLAGSPSLAPTGQPEPPGRAEHAANGQAEAHRWTEAQDAD